MKEDDTVEEEEERKNEARGGRSHFNTYGKRAKGEEGGGRRIRERRGGGGERERLGRGSKVEEGENLGRKQDGKRCSAIHFVPILVYPPVK